MTTPIFSVQHIYKSFGSNNVLDDINIDFMPGEIHALIGVNGAGKSTLVKIMQGIYTPDKGDLYFSGERIKLSSPTEAINKGIAMVFQELNLFKELTVTENIMLCEMQQSGKPINWNECDKTVQSFLDSLGIEIDPTIQVKQLPLAKQQLVEIAKCIYRKPKLIFLDEPSSSLSQAEEKILYQLIRDLKSSGITVVLITHKMEEIFQFCDNISILRDGHCVANGPVSEFTLESITHHMLGKSVDIFKKTTITHGNAEDIILSVKNLTYKNTVKNISFDLRRHEILAFTGLVGSGKSDLARTLFGVNRNYEGEIVFEGKNIHPRTPSQAIKNGIGHVPISRKDEGIMPNFSLAGNISLSILDKLGFKIDKKKEIQIANDQVDSFNIMPKDIAAMITSLSGGNQQKVVFSRWVAGGEKLIILDEPTRGVDVGAKQEIYDNLRRLAETGMGVIICSSETDELMSSSDRILVMRMGEIVKELVTAETSAEEILKYSIASEKMHTAS